MNRPLRIAVAECGRAKEPLPVKGSAAKEPAVAATEHDTGAPHQLPARGGKQIVSPIFVADANV